MICLVFQNPDDPVNLVKIIKKQHILKLVVLLNRATKRLQGTAWRRIIVKGSKNIDHEHCFIMRKIRVFLETQAKIHIQNLVISEKLELAYSYMSVFDNRNNPNEDNYRIIEDFFIYATVFIDPGKEVIVEQRAEKIKTQGIKNKDTIHWASAIEAECDYFLTTDDVVLKRYAEKRHQSLCFH